MRMKTQSGMLIVLGDTSAGVCITTVGAGAYMISSGELTNSEALELAAELVKLAMPDATSETVSIM